MEIGRGEVGQWKHPERVDGFVVERGRLRVDMDCVRQSIRDTARKTRYPGSRSLDARTQNLLEGARWLGFAPLSPVGIRAGESKRWPVFFPGGLISLEARIVDRDTLAQQEIFYDLPVSLGDR